MAEIQVIKRRIRSVKSTRQITKAMELVAASKMRRAQDASLRSRTYSASALEILERLSRLTHARDYSLFRERQVKNQLVILITSDRGLAGAYNSNLLRKFAHFLRDSEGIATKIITIGAKGSDFTKRLKEVELIGAYADFPTHPTSVDIRPIHFTMLELFTKKKIDRATVIYTDFVSTVKQQVVAQELLPIKLSEVVKDVEGDAGLDDALFEPSPQAVLEAMVPRLIEAQLYQAVLDASASEHSMRMMAMKNASDNARDLVDDLTLAFNSARQAAITQELAEITAGAEAVN